MDRQKGRTGGRFAAWLVALLASGCAEPGPETKRAPGIAARVEVAAPWRVEDGRSGEVVLRLGGSPQGVRVVLDGTPGVTPIHGGRPAIVGGTPLFAPAFAPTSAEVVSDGPDLVVRFAGPPLRALLAEAPADPSLAWVRLRPRGEDWRVSTTGLARVTLPADGLTVGTAREGFVVTGPAGVWAARPGRVAHRSLLGGPGGAWTFDTTPALAARDPYGVVGWVWTPPR